jgi:hypothetical protein
MKRTKRLLSTLILAAALAPTARAADDPPMPEPKKVSIRLQQVPFRDALEGLFRSSGGQVSMSPEVANIPITLSLQDVSFDTALRLMIRQAAATQPGLILQKLDNQNYVVRVRDETAPAAEEAVTERLPIQFYAATELRQQLERLTLPAGVELLESLPRDNSLLVRATPTALVELKRLVRLLDNPTRSLSIRVGVTGPGADGRPLQIASRARTLNAKEVVIDEETSSGDETARIKVQVRPLIQGDGQILVESDWDISVPVAGGAKGPIRLVKRLTSTARLQSTRGITVGEVDLGPFGGKGTVRLWLRADLLSDFQYMNATTDAGEPIEQVQIVSGTPHVSALWLASALSGQLRKSADGSYEILPGKPADGPPLPEGELPSRAGPFRLVHRGQVISYLLMFAVSDNGVVLASAEGEPLLPLDDLARFLGGKLEYNSATDSYHIHGGGTLGALRHPAPLGK